MWEYSHEKRHPEAALFGRRYRSTLTSYSVSPARHPLARVRTVLRVTFLAVRPRAVNIDFLQRASELNCRSEEKQMAKEIFIEQRPQGDYAIRRPGSERASGIEQTQAEAIERAREIAPSASILVERVRDTDRGGRDKWRRP
jgi:hypothetical protein